MKLSEIRGQEAIDCLANMLEPASIVFTDEKVINALKHGTRIEAVRVLLKTHPKEVMQILAYSEGEDPETYNPSMISIPKKLLEIFNDPEVRELFFSPDQTKEETSSSPVMENTEGSQI